MRGTKGMLKRERIGVPAVTFGGWLGSNKHRDKERLRMGGRATDSRRESRRGNEAIIITCYKGIIMVVPGGLWGGLGRARAKKDAPW